MNKTRYWFLRSKYVWGILCVFIIYGNLAYRYGSLRKQFGLATQQAQLRELLYGSLNPKTESRSIILTGDQPLQEDTDSAFSHVSTAQDHELNLVISADKTTFKIGEEVVITSNISNIGNNKLSIFPQFLTEPEHLIISIGSRNDVNKGNSYYFSPTEYIILGPGETKSFQFKLGQWLTHWRLEHLRLGQDRYNPKIAFTIRYLYQGRDNYYPSTNVKAKVEFPWVGTIVSNPIEITLLRDVNVLLQEAVFNNDFDAVNELLNQGDDPGSEEVLNYFESNALTQAIWKGNYAIIELLLDKGANVNARGHSGTILNKYLVFSRLMEGGRGLPDPQIIKLLLEHGAVVDDKVLEAARPRKYLSFASMFFVVHEPNPNYRSEKFIYDLLVSKSKKSALYAGGRFLKGLTMIAVVCLVLWYIWSSIKSLRSIVKKLPKGFIFYSVFSILLHTVISVAMWHQVDIFIDQAYRNIWLEENYPGFRFFLLLIMSFAMIISCLEMLKLEEWGRLVYLNLAVLSSIGTMIFMGPMILRPDLFGFFGPGLCLFAGLLIYYLCSILYLRHSSVRKLFIKETINRE